MPMLIIFIIFILSEKNIQKESQLENINKNTKIYTHILDYSIKQLCSNIESAKSNLLHLWRFKMPIVSAKKNNQRIGFEASKNNLYTTF